jgi:8-oxo-dGTP pyrophosphatase MutT (NUDIX family)
MTRTDDDAPPFKPALTVAVVVAREGKLLFVEEHSQQDHADNALVLNQPAGHLEPGETLVQAAVRETREETGWDVEVTHFIGVYRWTAPNGITYVRFAFAAEPLRHHPEQPLDDGIERALWLTPAQLRAAADRHRSPLVEAVLDDWLAGVRLPLSVLREFDAARNREPGIGRKADEPCSVPDSRFPIPPSPPAPPMSKP